MTFNKEEVIVSSSTVSLGSIKQPYWFILQRRGQ